MALLEESNKDKYNCTRSKQDVNQHLKKKQVNVKLFTPRESPLL